MEGRFDRAAGDGEHHGGHHVVADERGEFEDLEVTVRTTWSP